MQTARLINRARNLGRAALALLLVGNALAAGGPKVTVVLAKDAPALEKLAADQLASDLKVLFQMDVSIQNVAPSAGEPAILLGTPEGTKLGPQGHMLKSTPKGLIVGGGSPLATCWAVSELSYQFGMRHLLYGDVAPTDAPEFRLDGFDLTLDTKSAMRCWDGYHGSVFGMESWGMDDADRLLRQLVKLKFTHLLLPEKLTPFEPLPVDGDTAGRTAFKGAKVFANPDGEKVLAHLEARAASLGLGVVTSAKPVLHLGAPESSVLPQFSLHAVPAGASGSFRAVMPGDLNAAVHFVSRSAFNPALTPEAALAELVTPMCGDGVAERMQLGFEMIGRAAGIIAKHDPKLGVPGPDGLARHLHAKADLPPWITEVKGLYAGAMNEMYRANTRARGGPRPFILYHAKRLEFAVHYLTAVESLYKAHDAAVRDESLEAALEASYNALNAYADVARDPSDRGVIAILNEHGYRALMQLMEAGSR